ncbi:MAG: hypothetical protein ACLTE2_08390 [Eubacteriales bacterium]
MRRRAAIAVAIMLSPELLILDEATTGLDVIVEADILKTLMEIREREHTSILFVSHDHRIAKSFCDEQVNYETSIISSRREKGISCPKNQRK